MIIEEQTPVPASYPNRSLIRRRIGFLVCLLVIFGALFWFSKPATPPALQITTTGVHDLYYLTIRQGTSALTLETDNALFLEPIQSLTPKIVELLNAQSTNGNKDDLIFALNRFLYPYYITDIFVGGGMP